MNYVFSDVEWAKMKHMTKAIWGVDLETLKYVVSESTAERIQFHVLNQEPIRPYLIDDLITGIEHRMTFNKEVVELDRWLIPWKVKAGYSERMKLLVYRVVQ